MADIVVNVQVYTTSKWHFVRGYAFGPCTLVVEPFAAQFITHPIHIFLFLPVSSPYPTAHTAQDLSVFT